MMSWTCLSIAEVVADFLASSAQCPIAHLKCIGPNAYAAIAKQASPKSSTPSSFSFCWVSWPGWAGGEPQSGWLQKCAAWQSRSYTLHQCARLAENQLLILADRTAVGRSESVEARSVKELKEQGCLPPVLLKASNSSEDRRA
ncbi:hypothetical protein NKI19_21610 [Mesorhizobium sp. M0751]|uniref:hypothetical protein n=1 Tax=unclassified Mesorhizobium TaxID=325217 RepID=UPI003335522C